MTGLGRVRAHCGRAGKIDAVPQRSISALRARAASNGSDDLLNSVGTRGNFSRRNDAPAHFP
jgi:hypothetical protein